jgi:hypothetical protein
MILPSGPGTGVAEYSFFNVNRYFKNQSGFNDMDL